MAHWYLISPAGDRGYPLGDAPKNALTAQDISLKSERLLLLFRKVVVWMEKGTG
jgi:hypothetical protein